MLSFSSGRKQKIYILSCFEMLKQSLFGHELLLKIPCTAHRVQVAAQSVVTHDSYCLAEKFANSTISLLLIAEISVGD